MAKSNSELYDISKNSPYKVTGSPSDMSALVDDVSNMGPGREAFDGAGTQSGQHPAKSQSKVMRFIE
jgi:hypothetical protein